MADIPDISSMSPDRWLSKMQQVREELLEEFDAVLDGADGVDEAVDMLEEMLSEYSVKSETGESKRLLEVRVEEEVVVFEHESGKTTFEIAVDDEGRWYDVGDGRPDEPEEEPSSRRRKLAVAALKLIPWWTEGAFTRRVGRPRDFTE